MDLLVRFLIAICLNLITFSFALNKFHKFKHDQKLSKIQIRDKWFVDEHNRVVLFHGINAVQKQFPWIPNTKEIDMTNKTQLFNLKKWGLNVVRLGVMWSGLAPKKII